MKSNIFNRLGWVSALALICCLGRSSNVSAQQGCDLAFSPSPAELCSYITVYPYYDPSLGAQQQLTSYFLVQVASIATPTNCASSPIPLGNYPAWCIDEGDFLSASYSVPGTFYSGLLYSTCDTNLDNELPPGHPNTLVSPAVWQMVNYILNFPTYNGATVFYWDEQAAINTLVGSAVGTPDPCGGLYTTPTPSGECQGYPVYDPVVVQALLTAASNNAPTWIPQCGQVIGAIYVTSASNQFLLLPVPVPCGPCIGVTKEIACLQPTNNCGSFGKIAEGYVGTGCAGLGQPAFCYQITVTNCGNIPLTNIVVLDNLLGNLTTNFFTNQTQVLAPGASITALLSMSVSTNTTNTVTVTGEAALAQPVTNHNQVVVTNGTPVTASDYAVAVVDSAAVTCDVTLSSANALSGNNGNDLILPAASYYSGSNTVNLSIHVCNSGVVGLTGLTISAPALAPFNCTMPPAFSLAPGGCQDFTLCIGTVTCPAQLNFNLNVAGQIVSDTNHCGIYDMTSTNLISVCSSCSGSISCSPCTNGPANLSGTVLLHCNGANTSTNGDSGLSGIPVTLLGAASNLLATSTTDTNGNYSFINLGPGIYYVLVTMPTNYVETYPPGDVTNEIAVTIVSCTSVSNIDFGYANTLPPSISVVPGNFLGCNPTNLPTVANVSSNVTTVVSCGSASNSITYVDNITNCVDTRTFTIVVTDTYGNKATTNVVYTWTTNTSPPLLSGVPTNAFLGCNPTNVPTVASVQSAVSSTNDTCSPATIIVTGGVSVTNGCSVTQVFNIMATNACGNTATAYVTNTWTANTTPPVLNGVPPGKNLGCNPTNIPTLASVQSAVSSTNDTCSPATVHVTVALTTNSCTVTQVFTIIATNSCGNSVMAHVTNTWTADTTVLALTGVPVGTNFGCNPTNIPTAASVQASVHANDTCSTATVNVTGVTNTNGCAVTQIFTIIATNACGNVAAAHVTNTWTAATTPPVITGLPTGCYLGCSTNNLPGDTNIYKDVSASGHCSTASIVVTHQDSTNGCTGIRTFLIVATDSCGNYASTNLTYTWNAGSGPIVVCPSNVVITTNICKVSCTFTPQDWNTPCIGFNPTGCNGGNWNWNWWGNNWSVYANNWWLGYCMSNSPTNCWPSWSNWWTTCNGTNPGTNWWDSWTNVGNGNHWSGCWTTLNGNWWNQWLGNAPRNNQYWVPCGGNNPYDVLTNCFTTVYTNGCLKIGSTNGYCLSFTSPAAIKNCLGFNGAPGFFNCSATNPTTCNAGSFCSQVLALQINCDFGDCTNAVPDFFGRCGDAVLIDPTSPCYGQTVRGILGICNTAIGCGSLPPGCSFNYLCSLVTNLNQCFEGGQVSSWCSTHLAPVYIPLPCVTGTATVTDTCSPNPCVTYCDVVSNSACQGHYVIYRTWLAVDACGHSNSCVQTITVEQGASSGISGAVVLACSGDTNLSNNEGVASVTVTLKNSGGTTVATTTTSSSGAYSFANLPAGTYTVVVTPPSGYTETVPTGASNSQTVTLSGCQTQAGVSFGYNGSSPAVKIIKTGPCSIAHGQTACYSFAVTNTGNTCLTLKVNDPLLGGVIFTESSVAPGQGFVFSSNYVVVQTNGTLTNTAWVIGTPPTGNSVSNQATTTAIITTKCVTNTICGNFNSQNPGSGWLWCNAHISCNPGKKSTVFCQNASITLNCTDGKSYTFPIPNGQINFSPTCTVATNWFDGTQWNTTLPCAGDNEIFLHGCAIPWQADFANCQSVCWTGVFSCDTAGISCNWQWGAACYNNSQPSFGSICPKACHQTSCPNGQYYNSSDHAGCPENTKPYCVGGATGGGGSNCTGSFGSTGSCSF